MSEHTNINEKENQKTYFDLIKENLRQENIKKLNPYFGSLIRDGVI